MSILLLWTCSTYARCIRLGRAACYASKSKSISVHCTVARPSSVAVRLVFVTLIVDGMATNYFAEADSNCKCAVESGRWPSLCLSVCLFLCVSLVLYVCDFAWVSADRQTALPSVRSGSSISPSAQRWVSSTDEMRHRRLPVLNYILPLACTVTPPSYPTDGRQTAMC